MDPGIKDVVGTMAGVRVTEDVIAVESVSSEHPTKKMARSAVANTTVLWTWGRPPIVPVKLRTCKGQEPIWRNIDSSSLKRGIFA